MSQLALSTPLEEKSPKMDPLLEYPVCDAIFQQVRALVADISNQPIGNIYVRQYLHEDQRLSQEDINSLIATLTRQLGLRRTRCLRWQIKQIQAARAEEKRKEEASRPITRLTGDGANGTILNFTPKRPWDMQIAVLILACQRASRSRTSKK